MAWWSRFLRSGLEQLDKVPRWIADQPLRAAGARDDVVAERHALGAQPGDLGPEVVDDEMDAVPTARPGLGAVGHRAAGRALRATQQQTQIAALHIGERGRRRRQHGEAEMA